MKKIITLFAAAMLLCTMSFAQQKDGKHVYHSKSASVAAKKNLKVKPLVKKTDNATKAVGDTISTFPWTESFDLTTLPTGFIAIDADGDGYNWDCTYWNTNDGQVSNIYSHSGNGVIASASYINDIGALSPDNWLILPAFEIPAGSEYELTWYEADYDYPESYSVYITTAGNTTNDFLAGTATSFTTNGQTVSYVKRAIDLSSYAGQIVHIAFRHFNVTDNYWLFIDDIRVGGPSMPEVIVDGPSNVELGQPAVYTATGASSYSWYVDGIAVDTEGDTMITTFTTTGTHEVVAGATNVAGTAYDTLEVNVFSCSEAITAMPWNESFEGITDCWLFITADNVSDGFVISYDGGRTGEAELIGTWSDDVNLDQWAISPLITLPSDANNYILKFYALTREWEGVLNHYQVYVTTVADPTPSDFTTPIYDETSATDDFVRRDIDLDSYAGQTIRFAFRNISAMGCDAMEIDDIYIGVRVAPDMDVTGPEAVRVGEPAIFQALTEASTVTWSIDGTVLNENGLTLTHTFDAPGVYTVTASATNAAGTASASIDVEAIECNPIALPHSFDFETELNLCWETNGWDVIGIYDEIYLYSMSNYYGIMDLDPDNWVYTPYLTMPESGSYEIGWKVMPYSPELPSDHYGVYVITDDSEILLYQETLTEDITEPAQRSVTIPASVTGNFKVAFRHYETTGGYVILIKDIEVVAEGTIGIENVDEASVNVYPNPANNVLNIQGEGIQQVDLMDINGRTVMSSNEAGSMNISNLACGIYIVRVVTNQGVSTQKIIKK